MRSTGLVGDRSRLIRVVAAFDAPQISWQEYTRVCFAAALLQLIRQGRRDILRPVTKRNPRTRRAPTKIARPATPNTTISRQRAYYRVSEVIALMGISRTMIYDGIRSGEIPSRQVGRAVLIPAMWVHAATDEDAR